MRVSFGPELTGEQRLAVAKVAGAGQRWAFGWEFKDRPQADAVAALHEISRDPVVFGIAMGTALAYLKLDGQQWYAPLVEMYREAGADEQVAAANLAWHRAERARRTTHQ